MKNNTSKTKDLLMQAIQVMPSDFALSEAKFYMKLALERINKVESKRFRREQVAMAEKAERDEKANKLVAWEVQSEEEGARILQNLDAMIDAEKGSLEQIKERKNNKSTKQIPFWLVTERTRQ